MAISQIYKDFLKDDSQFLFLEGTTASGKTTVSASWKFIPRILKSKKKLHVLLGRSVGVIEKNLIQQDHGIMYYWSDVFTYNGNGNKEYKMPHLINDDGTKVIFLIGYDNSASWLNLLGGQYGEVFFDEINTANMECVREISSRCDHMIGTMNPDSPDLEIYSEYINKAVMMRKDKTPQQIQDMMLETDDFAHHWFFTFEDNVSLTAEDIEKKKRSIDPSTKIYKNKILGLRVRAEGLVFPHAEKCYWDELPDDLRIFHLSCGVDTSYSAISNDEVTLTLSAVTNYGLVILKTDGWNNKDLNIPLAPSDTYDRIVSFLSDTNCHECYIDSADQATIIECQKRRNPNIKFVSAYKKTQKIDRINLFSDWIWNDRVHILKPACKGLVNELGKYSWSEKDGQPEDGNDHYWDGCCYSWLPFVQNIKAIPLVKLPEKKV